LGAANRPGLKIIYAKAVFKAGKLIDNNWLPIHCPVGGNVSCVTLFTMGIIQLLIYDLHAQLKPHPKPTKMTHYCTQLSCISIAMSVRPHNFPNNRWGMPHTGEEGGENKSAFLLTRMRMRTPMAMATC